MKKQLVIEPSYYESFSCLGSACNCTCCKEWDIRLKKSEYTAIKNTIKTKEMRRLFCDAFRRDKKTGTDMAYAKVSYDENQRCKFLDEQDLCLLQKTCGHGALPKTCQWFPRHISYTLGVFERDLSLGCEATVQLLFDAKKGICFEEKEAPEIELKTLAWAVFPSELEERPLYQYIWDIKTLAASILQDRNFSLDDRMLLLGMALRSVDQLEQEKRVEEIPELVNRFLGAAEHLDSLDQLRMLPINSKFSMYNALFMLDGMTLDRGIMTEMMKQIYKNIGVEESIMHEEYEKDGVTGSHLQKKLDIDAEKYQQAQNRLGEVMKKYPHFLENVMVAWFFFGQQPFYDKNRSVWDNFIYYANLYNMLKFAVAGYLTDTDNRDDLIHVVTVCARTLTHSFKKALTIIDHARENESDTLAHMAILIKS